MNQGGQEGNKGGQFEFNFGAPEEKNDVTFENEKKEIMREYEFLYADKLEKKEGKWLYNGLPVETLKILDQKDKWYD